MECAFRNPRYILICIVLISWTIDASPQFDLGQLMKAFVGPFLANQKLQLMTNSRRAAHTKSKTTIEAVIEKKIAELKNVLQDNDKIEDKLDLDHDDTTIIEFYPKIPKKGLRTEKNNSKSSNNDTEPFTVDVEKYKKIKRKIDKILAKDTLTKDGKKIITNAFEDIVGKLLKNQCTWKSVMESTKTRRNNEKSEEDAMKQWKRQFEILKNKYFHVLKRTEAPVSIEDLIQIFESFNDFFSQVMSDINGMSKRYEIKCKLIDKKRKLQYSPMVHNDLAGSGNKNFRVQSLDDGFDGTCKNFRVCSLELSEFLKDFYTKVNDTICSAFKNYAAMYDRDVNTDNSEEGTMVTEIINKTGDALEIKLAKIYKKKVHTIQLDPKKDKQKNMKIINDFIKKVTESLNETVHKALDKDFGRLSHKLQESVKHDVSVNVGIELQNLQKRTTEKVCSMFDQCNGMSGRRDAYGDNGDGVEENQDDNLVFVQLKVNLTDETLARAAKVFLRSHHVSPTTEQPLNNYTDDDHSANVRTVKDDLVKDHSVKEHNSDGSNGDQLRVDHPKKHHHRHSSHKKVIVTRTTTLKSSEEEKQTVTVTRTTTSKSSRELHRTRMSDGDE